MAEQNLTNFTDALEKVKATEKPELPVDNIVRRKNINWRKLRDKFFDECTDEIKYNSTGTQTQMRKVNMTPHNLFEWFKKQIQGYA